MKKTRAFFRPAIAAFALIASTTIAQAGTLLVGLNAPDSRVLQYTTGGSALGPMVGPPMVQDPTSFSIDITGNLYIGSQDTGSIVRRTTDGTISTFKSGLGALLLIEVGPDDGVYFTRTAGGSTIERVNQDGSVDVVVSGLTNTRAIAFDDAGDMYYSANGSDVFRYNFVSGTSSLFASVGYGVSDMSFDSLGNLLVVGEVTNQIDSIDPTGTISLFASMDGGTSLTLDEFGNVYVASFSNGTVRKFLADGSDQGNLISGLQGPIPVGYFFGTAEGDVQIPAPPALAGLLTGLGLIVGFRRRRAG